MYILGIGCYYHDSSATLIKDGVVVAAAAEERFTRIKHDTSFPINAISYCLENISIKDIKYIAFYEKPLLKFERILSQHLNSFPLSLKTFLKSMPHFLTTKLRLVKTIKKKLGYKGDILFINHHMAHAGGSYLTSEFENAAIVTVDGVGEWTTTAFGIGKENKITLLQHIEFPHSIGLLYSTITAYLGFSVNNSEYKVMGLSSCGNMNPLTNKYYPKLKRIIKVNKDGSFSLDLSYFTFHYKDKMPSKKLCNLLGGPVEKKDAEMTMRHEDIAAALQIITEEILIKILNHVHNVTKQDNLCLSGGVALNSVFNGKILRKTPFKKVWIHPAAGDGGTSLGAALYVYNSILDKKRVYSFNSPFLGPEFSTEDIRKFLLHNKIKYTEIISTQKLIEKTAELIAQNNVVGWFQGRMEWGPRALGARSILSNPCNPDMQHILNEKVKHREKFRPFAPVVCEDDALDYFDCDKPIPAPTDYMLMVYPIFKKWQAIIPSVTHVDGSGRLQTIRRVQNPNYYDLIKEFGKITKVPIMINTSFNIRGEPIVCTPLDAYKCMMGTGIDLIVMDKFIIKREENLKDAWDSEVNGKD